MTVPVRRGGGGFFACGITAYQLPWLPRSSLVEATGTPGCICLFVQPFPEVRAGFLLEVKHKQKYNSVGDPEGIYHPFSRSKYKAPDRLSYRRYSKN